MNRDDVIRMAREAGGYPAAATDRALLLFSESHLERFAALVAAAERDRVLEIAKGMQEELQAKFEQNYMQGVIAGAAAEREACAKVCEDIFNDPKGNNGDDYYYTRPYLECAAAIRARGEVK